MFYKMASMKEQEAKKEYDDFLHSGDLQILFPGLHGEWDKDKKIWIKIWVDNQRAINGDTKKPNNN